MKKESPLDSLRSEKLNKAIKSFNQGITDLKEKHKEYLSDSGLEIKNAYRYSLIGNRANIQTNNQFDQSLLRDVEDLFESSFAADKSLSHVYQMSHCNPYRKTPYDRIGTYREVNDIISSIITVSVT